METQVSLPRSQEPAIGPFIQSHAYSLHPPTPFSLASF
jgi:hypothetical protein